MENQYSANLAFNKAHPSSSFNAYLEQQQPRRPISTHTRPSPPITTRHDSGDSSVYSKVEFNKQLAQSSLLSDDSIQRSASQFGIRPQSLFDQIRQYHETAAPPPPPQVASSHFTEAQPSYAPQESHNSISTTDDEDAYKFLVRHLQRENEQLLIALRRSHDSLVKCRQRKMRLEDMLQDQRKVTLDKELEDYISQHHSNATTEWNKEDMLALVEQVERRQRRDTRHRNDLLFQKRYLLLANAALESCEKESLDVLQQLGVTKADPPPSPWFKCRACVWAIIAVQRFQSRATLTDSLLSHHDQQKLSNYYHS